MQYLLLCVWLYWLNMISSSVHGFVPMYAVKYCTVCTYYIFLILPPTDGLLVCLHNWAAINIGVQLSLFLVDFDFYYAIPKNDKAVFFQVPIVWLWLLFIPGLKKRRAREGRHS